MHGSAIRYVRSHDQNIWNNGKFAPSKYKMAKDIQTPPRLYDYVAESSCCAKSEQNRPTQFCWENTGIWVFLLIHTQSINQSNKLFHLVYRQQIWKDLKHLWLKSRGFTPRCAVWGYRWWEIMFRGSKFSQNRILGVWMGLSSINDQKIQNRLTWKPLSRSWWNFHSVYTPWRGLRGWSMMSNNKSKTADSSHFELQAAH